MAQLRRHKKWSFRREVAQFSHAPSNGCLTANRGVTPPAAFPLSAVRRGMGDRLDLLGFLVRDGAAGFTTAGFCSGLTDCRVAGEEVLSAGQLFVPEPALPMPYAATPITAHPTTTVRPASPTARPQPFRGVARTGALRRGGGGS